mgnify:CR=1 FL=1|jgi:DNA recombination protein RmuC|tara:strand:+ start:68 stop:1114 length:1047 start_codon:yes stop_codon:yes gene_type:complete
MFSDQFLIFILGFLFGILITIIFIWIIFFRKKTDLESISNKINTIEKDFNDLVKKDDTHKTLIEDLGIKNDNLIANVQKLETTLTKGSSVIQGNWGQTICENILKEIGFKKGREYESQKKYLDIDGKEKIPDFVIHLPENRHYIIDSKVSNLDWYDYINSKNDTEREQAKKRHIMSIMKHIKDLSEVGYSNLRDLNNGKELNTGEFILMFMPMENSFQSLADESEKIRVEALKNNITIVGPSTLHLAMRIVEQMWSMDKQAKNTKDAISIAYRMYAKASNINKSFQTIKKSISTAQRNIEAASKQIESGDGNFISLLNNFRQKLGLVTKELDEKDDNKDNKGYEEIEN